MHKDLEGYYPVVDEKTCTFCTLCEVVCPLIRPPNVAKHFTRPQAFAAWHLDTKIRGQSSSGGVFTALAQQILADGGVVFGAAFTPDFKSVQHIGVENEKELEKLRGSKYVLSSTSEALPQVKKLLASGRKVLFVGAPCQVAGLKNIIRSNKERALLFTCDFVCHGVPSSTMFEKYITAQEARFGGKTTSYNFRHPRSGWSMIDVHQEFDNGKVYHIWNWGDAYMYAFYKNLTLQPACYDCKFQSFPRGADITLADFWGIQKKYPDYDDNKGTSLVLINSEAGRGLFSAAGSRFFHAECDFDFAVHHNAAFTHVAKPHPRRSEFLQRIDTVPFAHLVQDFIEPRFMLKRRVSRFYKKTIWKWRDLKRAVFGP